MTKEEAVEKIITGDDGYTLVIGENEEAVKATLEELSDGRGDEYDEQ